MARNINVPFGIQENPRKEKKKKENDPNDDIK